jgi:hypothetical protein
MRNAKHARLLSRCAECAPNAIKPCCNWHRQNDRCCRVAANVADGSTCRSCKALVLWCITDKGKRQPVDAKPTEAGNLLIERRGTVLYARLAGLFDPPGERFMPHHATCPQADEWRAKQ